MSLETALTEIESHNFAAKLNVVSNTRSFFRSASREPVVAEVFQSMLESGESREEVLGRIYDLSRLDIDRRYENPKDAALAVLLWLTYSSNHQIGLMAADLIDRTPQCWYATKLARDILAPQPTATTNARSGEQPSQIFGPGNSSTDMVVMMNPVLRGVGTLRQVEIGKPSSPFNTVTWESTR